MTQQFRLVGLATLVVLAVNGAQATDAEVEILPDKAVPFLESRHVSFRFTLLPRELREVKFCKTVKLEEAYERALATDQSIRNAYLEIRKANLVSWNALARLEPQVTGGGAYGNLNKDESGISSSKQTTFRTRLAAKGGATSREVAFSSTAFASSRSEIPRTAVISLEQPLVDLTVLPAYRLGKLSAKAARFQHQSTVRDILLGVAKAYYEVLKQERLVTIGEQTVNLARQQQNLAQRRATAGEVTQADVSRASVTVERSRRALLDAESSRETARNVLWNILNLGRERDYAVTEPPSAPTDVPRLEAAIERAYATREDYKANALFIDEAMERRNEVIGGYAPRIVAKLQGKWGDTSVSTSEFARRSSSSSLSGFSDGSLSNSSAFGQPSNEWSATLNFEMPLGGHKTLELKTADYQIGQARLNYEKLAKAVEQEVTDAWLAVQTFREKLKALRTEVAAAEQNYKDLQNQYEAGTATSLDTLVALRDLDAAHTELVVQTYDYQVALRNLQRAMGVFQEERVRKVKVP